MRYWLALNLVNGLGDVLTKSLFTRFDSAESVFKASKKELTGIEGIGEKIVDAIYGFSDWDRVESELEKYKKSGFSFLPLNDPRYPKPLIQTYNPPPFLYMKGEMIPEDQVSIAIVGSRLPDRYGRMVTESIAGELASLGVTVVSGMARGIDSIAQEEALKRGGRTIAVLGSGLDVVYPPENKKLYKDISEKGALLSEFLIGTPPIAQNFPRRNRIISGISLGVLVVQASEKSGSLISASFAIDQNKEVFAVPGNIDRKLSRGTNWLLKKGAKLVETVDDVLGEIEILKNLKSGESGERPEAVLPLLSDKEKAVYSVLGAEAIHVDNIIKLTGLESSNVLSLLLSLELNGFVTQCPGKNFCRKI
ncbi:MAG: DNA-processing protein DprA [Deltaproteobacteria bacterium]